MRWITLVWAAVIGVCLLASSAGLCSSNEKSHTGQDFVRIQKITPRTGADLPTPTLVPFHLEVACTLKSASRGKVRVGVFRLRPGAKGSAFQPLISPVEKDVIQGQQTLVLQTEPVALESVSEKNAQIAVVVNLRNGSGKELAWATSHNFLRGSLSVRPEKVPVVRNSLHVLSFFPKVGSLRTGRGHTFAVNMRYSVATAAWGFINLELGDRGLLGQAGPWYSVVVPVRKGVGFLRVTTRDFFLPAAYTNKQIELAIPFRVDPLGGTVDILRFGPWSLTQPDVR
jgi:hypothetical protein